MAALYTTVTDLATGSVRYRKTRTTEAAVVFDVMSVRKTLLGERRTDYLKVLEKITLYIDPDTLQICIFRRAGSLPVKLVVQKQHRGERLFWVCPQSGEKASLLYLVQTEDGPVLGSRKGLGLSYPSQALHRTPVYDAAVYTGRLETSLTVYLRVASRRQQRRWKALKRGAREFS